MWFRNNYQFFLLNDRIRKTYKSYQSISVNYFCKSQIYEEVVSNQHVLKRRLKGDLKIFYHPLNIFNMRYKNSYNSDDINFERQQHHTLAHVLFACTDSFYFFEPAFPYFSSSWCLLPSTAHVGTLSSRFLTESSLSRRRVRTKLHASEIARDSHLAGPKPRVLSFNLTTREGQGSGTRGSLLWANVSPRSSLSVR